MYILSLISSFGDASCQLRNTRKLMGFSFGRRLLHRTSPKMRSSYEEAVYALNGLQSNSSVLEKARQERSANAHLNLTYTEKYLRLLGIQPEDLDALKVIHVGGTKGKGSTCAFSESILRHHGYKTGFYSSPHLISVNERIRINGQPISKELFASYFWHVYRSLQSKKDYDERMPPYFMFLTIMAFYIFVKEKVDCAVLEVGIGGLYDCTNIIRTPIVVGITTLGIDHVGLLGDTITKIAEQKAGIFKPDIPVYTVPQPEGAMAVLHRRARNVGCTISLSPPLEAYEEEFSTCEIGVPGRVQSTNASLALQLCRSWLHRSKEEGGITARNSSFCPLNVKDEEFPFVPVPIASLFSLSEKYCQGLQSCVWPGRFHTVKEQGITYYLDGAHTSQSMNYCATWFKEVSQKELIGNKSSVCRVLLFNCTGERKAESLLDPLSDIQFDIALFSPNKKSMTKDSASDQCNFMVDPEKEMEQCGINREIWCHLMRSHFENELTSSSIIAATTKSINSTFESKFCDPENTLVFPCLSSAVELINATGNLSFESDPLLKIIRNSSHVQVLVTGSLHLVGGVLSIIDPHLQSALMPASV